MKKQCCLYRRHGVRRQPDKNGHFGPYGGIFAPETLMTPLLELQKAYKTFVKQKSFKDELNTLLEDYAGRPTPLYLAKSLSAELGCQIYLKREDLTHTGAHKINNTLGQALLAKKMGKTRVIAETGAGQHGVAAAAAAAALGLSCTVYMGSVDMQRQSPNVARMKLMGAQVVPVDAGSRTLKDAINEAMRDWVGRTADTHYLLGSALGPHPYPSMVRGFQSVIGGEARRQILKKTGRLPDYLVACVGGGSNSIGLFYPFLGCETVKMIGVEAGGKSLKPAEHAARFAAGSLGVLQGAKTFILQDQEGQISDTHSLSAGLDYAAVGPEHAFLRDSGRIEFVYATDEEAAAAFETLSRLEGIIPALESSHAIAHIMTSRERFKGSTVILNLSGRGDKDMDSYFGFRKAQV